MKVKNIIVTGRLYKELENHLRYSPLLKNKEIVFLPESEITENALRKADGYASFKPCSNFKFYNLKWIHSFGAGVDSFLFNRSWKDDVVLTRTTGIFGRKIAQYCLSYMLSRSQYHKEFQEGKEKKQWNVRVPVDLKDQYVIVLGTGDIGQEIAKTLNYFGVYIVGVSLSGRNKLGFSKVIKVEELDQHLPKTHWIINTLPLTKKTYKILNRDVFCKTNGASLINVGRGETIEDDDLLLALDAGNIKEAILDVFSKEPLEQESKFWENPKITITPHISAITTVEEAGDSFLKTLTNLENQNYSPNIVDIKRLY